MLLSAVAITSTQASRPLARRARPALLRPGPRPHASAAAGPRWPRGERAHAATRDRAGCRGNGRTSRCHARPRPRIGCGAPRSD
eukprot:193031-Lingulodinium_polyedra.AAC.1